MHPTFWKTCTIILLVGWSFTVFNIHGGPAVFRHRQHHRPPSHHVPASVDDASPYARWEFDPTRDRDNHGLDTEQCTRAFPELYVEIDRAVDQWRHRHITPESIVVPPVNDGFARILIHDQQLRIIRTRGMYREDLRHRIVSVMHQIVRAITAGEAAREPLPDMEFNVIVNDVPKLDDRNDLALWAFTRAFGNEHHENLWLVPDFHFYAPDFPGGDSFREMQALARTHDSPLANKTPRAAWRGVTWTSPELREALLDAADGQPWADIEVSP